jgi:hypothetical protein
LTTRPSLYVKHLLSGGSSSGSQLDPQNLADVLEHAHVRDVERAVGPEHDSARRDETCHYRRLRAVRLEPVEDARPCQACQAGVLEDVEMPVRPPCQIDDEAERRAVGLHRLSRNNPVDVCLDSRLINSRAAHHTHAGAPVLVDIKTIDFYIGGD